MISRDKGGLFFSFELNRFYLGLKIKPALNFPPVRNFLHSSHVQYCHHCLLALPPLLKGDMGRKRIWVTGQSFNVAKTIILKLPDGFLRKAHGQNFTLGSKRHPVRKEVVHPRTGVELGQSSLFIPEYEGRGKKPSFLKGGTYWNE